MKTVYAIQSRRDAEYATWETEILYTTRQSAEEDLTAITPIPCVSYRVACINIYDSAFLARMKNE